MSPRIEEFQEIKQDEAEDIQYFTVDLMESESFNTDQFDNLALQLHEDDSEDVSFMKFIVIENKMYIFRTELPSGEKLPHDKMLQALNDSGIEGSVQCAGRIDVSFVKKYGQPDNRRGISSYSDTLKWNKRLLKIDSDLYKKEVIAKLGLPFTVD